MSEEHKKRTLEMIAVMQAYVDGKPIEFLNTRGQWEPDPAPIWDMGHHLFRIATTPDSINWDHVSPEWKYMARSRDGTVQVFKTQPTRGSVYWDSDSGMLFAGHFASYVRGTVDWKDSLVARPS